MPEKYAFAAEKPLKVVPERADNGAG